MFAPSPLTPLPRWGEGDRCYRVVQEPEECRHYILQFSITGPSAEHAIKTKTWNRVYGLRPFSLCLTHQCENTFRTKQVGWDDASHVRKRKNFLRQRDAQVHLERSAAELWQRS